MKVQIPYAPRGVQWELHRAIDEGYKHVALVWHRRAGKTVAIVNQLQKSALTCQRPMPQFAYIAPFLKQAKAVAWGSASGIKHFASKVPGVSVNESELSVTYPNGGSVRLFGADNPDALRGLYLDGVCLDEYGQINPRLRTEILLPALADREGYEVVCGTPMGRNQFYHLFNGDDEWAGAVNDPAWRAFLRRASETGILPPHVLRELLRQMGPQRYAQELECDWTVADQGTYYGAQLAEARAQGRVRVVTPQRGVVVHTAWDLGIGDATAIWFVQECGTEVHAIDFYEAQGEPLAHYAKVLQDKGYVYGEHFVPHDADHRSLQTGKTLAQMARALGLKVRVVPIGDFGAGVEASRQLLGRAWFDAERCKAGLAALDAYRKVYNARMDEHTSDPVHDWASHAADAWRTYAMARHGRELSPRMFRHEAPRFAKM